MKILKLYFFLLILLLLISCSKDKKLIEGTIDYKFFQLEKQGWKSKRVHKFVNTINYTATEVPIQYYIIKNEGVNNLEKVDSISKAHQRERIIEIEFLHEAQKDLLLKEYTERTYEDAVKYMSFNIQKDFKVVTSKSKDTVKCVGVTFERNFKLAPFKRLLLYFDNVSPDENIELIYTDRLFKNGVLKFNFNEIPIKL